MKKEIIKKVQVNLPLRMIDTYLDKFISLGLNPEIGIDASVLGLKDYKKAEDAALKIRENNLNITMHGPFMDLAVASNDPLIEEISRKRIYSVLPLVDIFQPKSIVFHPCYDYRRNGYLKDEWYKKSCEFWGEFAAKLSGRGVVLNLENVYERGPEEIKDIVEAVYQCGGGFCFDTGHHLAFGEEPLEKWIDSMGKYIKEIHLHDNDGKNDLHLPPGKGKIDFNPLLSYLESRKEFPQITFEPHAEEDLWPCFEWMETNNVLR